MSDEGPKLYTNKPNKAQVKQAQAKAKDFTVPPSSSSSASHGGSVPPPPPPKESFVRRNKFLWPLLLTVNLAVGGYVYFRTKKDNTSPSSEETETETKTVPPLLVTAEKPHSLAVAAEPVKAREPIPEKEQRELFKWMLDEKRKVKPKDPEEKKRMDEEKAILKQFIRAKTIPNL
ncbi:PREDICTED: uncharacterized protein LOC104810345 [Tarenaya hassleriana]|uniref:uncharacterized protein LOC104810345 n=1 Tax=Tarenaya hassleriana TaxID=28532 RepID=UPI00053C52B2|nr:PREDICTED: uncharacterized protein LOC104810345 [Tarenaya hassleriana]